MMVIKHGPEIGELYPSTTGKTEVPRIGQNSQHLQDIEQPGDTSSEMYLKIFKTNLALTPRTDQWTSLRCLKDEKV